MVIYVVPIIKEFNKVSNYKEDITNYFYNLTKNIIERSHNTHVSWVHEALNHNKDNILEEREGMWKDGIFFCDFSYSLTMWFFRGILLCSCSLVEYFYKGYCESPSSVYLNEILVMMAGFPDGIIR